MADPNIQALQNVPIYGKFLYDAFQSITKKLGNLSVQGNASLQGPENAPPPQVNSVNVTASGGVAHIQIIDNNENLYRGVRYHVQYATDAGFSAPCNGPSGPSRDIRIPVGNQPLFYRVFSDYPTSAPSVPVYHGGAFPIAIAATGTDQPPIPSGQGSGTGRPGQISGYGTVPWRGNTPPKRA
jgi:hypothetical protein